MIVDNTIKILLYIELIKGLPNNSVKYAINVFDGVIDYGNIALAIARRVIEGIGTSYPAQDVVDSIITVHRHSYTSQTLRLG